jgi:3-hydroxyisobutyrate dehydrogenase-like beta-hydroxyacid dehydrogenase
MQIGWIGLGNMGQVMAQRVLEAGHELTVYNRSPAKAQALIDRGAKLAESPAHAAQAELVVSMLADDAALEHVLGPGGALEAMSATTVHVSMSTISHALALALTAAHAERGVGFVGAPVFGRPDAAAAGKLFILAAGEADAVTRCRPLFDVLGQKVLPLGNAPAAAHLCKVLGNFMLISSVELLAEALNVAHAAGLDAAAVLTALTGSVFSAPFYANYGRMIAAQDFPNPPAFVLPLAHKDIELARAAAASVSAPLPSADAVRAKLAALLAAGGASLDLTALGRWSEAPAASGPTKK